MKKSILLLSFLLISSLLLAQEKSEDYSDKVDNLNAIIETLYSVISGDAGVKRDWDLFRYLFLPDAKLIPMGKNKEGVFSANYITADEYVERSGVYVEENGFFEKEIFRITEQYGNMVHVFSTYEAFQSSKDTKPFMRGINSIQLMNDGNRWWIVNISWEAETRKNPLPEKYLPQKSDK